MSARGALLLLPAADTAAATIATVATAAGAGDGGSTSGGASATTAAAAAAAAAAAVAATATAAALLDRSQRQEARSAPPPHRLLPSVPPRQLALLRRTDQGGVSTAQLGAVPLVAAATGPARAARAKEEQGRREAYEEEEAQPAAPVDRAGVAVGLGRRGSVGAGAGWIEDVEGVEIVRGGARAVGRDRALGEEVHQGARGRRGVVDDDVAPHGLAALGVGRRVGKDVGVVRGAVEGHVACAEEGEGLVGVREAEHVANLVRRGRLEGEAVEARQQELVVTEQGSEEGEEAERRDGEREGSRHVEEEEPLGGGALGEVSAAAEPSASSSANGSSPSPPPPPPPPPPTLLPRGASSGSTRANCRRPRSVEGRQPLRRTWRMAIIASVRSIRASSAVDGVKRPTVSSRSRCRCVRPRATAARTASTSAAVHSAKTRRRRRSRAVASPWASFHACSPPQKLVSSYQHASVLNSIVAFTGAYTPRADCERPLVKVKDCVQLYVMISSAARSVAWTSPAFALAVTQIAASAHGVPSPRWAAHRTRG